MMSRDKEYLDLVTVTILITLVDGSSIAGNLQKPRTKSMLEFMNYDVAFIEVERKDGSKVEVAKAALRTIEVTDNPRTDQLANEIRKFDNFEPYSILGVPKGATKEQIREAYLRMQRLYHPDRYTGHELPPEVADYIGAVARRVNLAYSMLSERGRSAH